MTGRILFLLLLLPLLAGCVADEPDPVGSDEASECEPFTVPAAMQGDKYAYIAEGNPGGISGPGGIVDWRVIDPDGERDWLDLAPASWLNVTIGESAMDRLRQEGDRVPAVPADYVVWDPRHPMAELEVNTQWIADGGDVVQFISHNYWDRGADRVEHSVRFGHHNRPALLGAPLFWGASWQTGDYGTVPVSHDIALPGVERATGDFDYDVRTIVADPDGTCRMTVAMDLRDPQWTDIGLLPTITLVFEEGVPLPAAYRFTLDGHPRQFTAVLEQYEPGTGPELPAFEPGPLLAQKGLPVGEPEADFLPDTGGHFNTDYATAVQVAKDSEAARVWFEQNPDARPYQVGHVLGAPDSEIHDQWRIVWVGAGGALHTVIDNRTRGSLVLDTVLGEFSVHAEPASRPDQPVGDGPRVSLAAVMDLHEEIYGKKGEVLFCILSDDGFCGIGTHDATFSPRASDTSGGEARILMGTMVGLSTGWVLQEASVDDALLQR